MEKRGIILANTESNEYLIMNNRTIMNFAKVYVQEENLDIKSSFPINYVRLFKKMYLPFKLVGMKGDVETEECKEVLCQSSVKWRFEFPTIPKPSKKSVELWKGFIV